MAVLSLQPLSGDARVSFPITGRSVIPDRSYGHSYVRHRTAR